MEACQAWNAKRLWLLLLVSVVFTGPVHVRLYLRVVFSFIPIKVRVHVQKKHFTWFITGGVYALLFFAALTRFVYSLFDHFGVNIQYLGSSL